ncbi:MAG TPA: hypothetical protein VFS34_17505 [Thermoanaerobaculia bacterium]|nr:hypothetical protein [Thermoanaerobaculia bacterium]
MASAPARTDETRAAGRTRVLGLGPLAALGILFSAVPLHGAQTYTYTGQNFSSVTAPYTTAEKVTGSFTTAVALPRFMPLTDVSGSIASYSFSDGVQSRTSANSFACDFSVATDGAGNVSAWFVYLTQAPHPALGDPEETMTLASASHDVVGSGAAVASACASIPQPVFGASPGPGSWSSSLPPGSPTTYVFTGQPFTSVTAPYATSEKVTGSVVFANPLPPFLPLTDVVAALSDFSFTDGVQTRTKVSSNVCQFEVATDGAGKISKWFVYLTQAPHPASGDPEQTMTLSGSSHDVVGSGAAVADPCAAIAQSIFAESAGPGTWSSSLPPPAPATYHYVGHPFSSATPPYSTSDELTGSITLAGRLPAFLPMTDISAALSDFSFTDGVQTRTRANSTVCTFEVATDGVGAITRWVVELREAPTPAPGNPQQNVDSTWSIGDLAGTGPAGATACAVISLSPAGSTSVIGSWTGPALPGTPVSYDYAGPFFTDVIAPYTTQDRITGMLRFGNPLPPNMPLADVTAAILDFSYSDGIQTRTAADSVICKLEVATDAAGRIVQWDVELRQRVASSSDPFSSIDSIHVGAVGRDLGGTNPAGGNPCGVFTLDPFGSTAPGGVGSWTPAPAGGGTAIPTLSGSALLVLAALTAAAGASLAGRARP